MRDLLKKHKSNITLLIVYFTAFIKSVIFSYYGFGLLDEGESLHNASRILAGDLPYKDFFSIFPPGDTYFFAWIIDMFGKSIFVPRIVQSFLFSFFPVLVFSFIKKINMKMAFLLSIAIIFIDVNVERLYIFSPIFLSLTLFLKGQNDRKYAYFFSGLLLGIISIIRFDIPGTYFFSFLVLVFVFDRVNGTKLKKTVVSIFELLLGYSLPIIGVLVWLGKNGLLFMFLNSVTNLALRVTKLHSLPFPSLIDIYPSTFTVTGLLYSFTALFGWIVIFSYAMYLFILLRKKDVIKQYSGKRAFIVFIAGVAALPYIMGRSDLGHIIKGGIPGLILLVFLTDLESVKKWSRNKLFTKGVYCFFLSIFLFGVIQSIYWIKLNDTRIIVGDYVLRLPSRIIENTTYPSALLLDDSVEFLQQSDNVLAIPYMAGVYYLAERSSPTEFNNVLAGFIVTEQEQKRFIDLLAQNDVERVVYDPNNGPKMQEYRFSQYNPLIDEYLMENYNVVSEYPEGWLFLELK